MIRTLSLVLLAGLAALAGPVQAASPWVESTGTRLRLVAGAREGAPPVYWAGIEIALQRGWKTYWRTPGDSGIPPSVDTGASRNLGTFELLWPAPIRFGEGPTSSIGYKDRVVLPLRVTPRDPRLPVFLDVSVAYGVCEEVCVPAQAKSSLILFGSGPDAVAIEEAREYVPRVVEGFVPGGLGVLSAQIVQDGGRRILELAVASEGATRPELIVEAPAGFALGAPESVTGGPDRLVYRLGLDPVTHERVLEGPLVSTLIVGKRALEQRWRVPDASPK